MIRVQLRPNEPLEGALRRFKRQCNYAGIFRLAKKSAIYEKPSEKRRREQRERVRNVQRALRKAVLAKVRAKKRARARAAAAQSQARRAAAAASGDAALIEDERGALADARDTAMSDAPARSPERALSPAPAEPVTERAAES